MIPKKLSIKNKRILLIVELELLILLVIVLSFWRDILNYGNIEEYANTVRIPSITADDGRLQFDSISIMVPKESATYVIGYDWAEDDKDYPTVPSSASVYYTDDSDGVMYEVLLYRDKVIPKIERERINTLESWSDSWKEPSENGSGQEQYATSDTDGFLIRSTGESSEDASESNKTYCSYAYYFAVETDSNIEQYVLEINYYDPGCIDRAEDIFREIADSILVGKTASA